MPHPNPTRHFVTPSIRIVSRPGWLPAYKPAVGGAERGGTRASPKGRVAVMDSPLRLVPMLRSGGTRLERQPAQAANTASARDARRMCEGKRYALHVVERK
jgi:hypothetical protein